MKKDTPCGCMSINDGGLIISRTACEFTLKCKRIVSITCMLTPTRQAFSNIMPRKCALLRVHSIIQMDVTCMQMRHGLTTGFVSSGPLVLVLDLMLKNGTYYNEEGLESLFK